MPATKRSSSKTGTGIKKSGDSKELENEKSKSLPAAGKGRRSAGKTKAVKPATKKPADTGVKKSRVQADQKVKASDKEDDGKTVEQLIAQRDIDIKSVEEYLGQKEKDPNSKPVIPGKYDLLIPPGTPRKIVLDIAKGYDVEIVRRDDIYIPIGVCDIQRDLLAIRGDKKTVEKMYNVLLEKLEKWVGD